MKRPELREVSLKDTLSNLAKLGICITMSKGQWDMILKIGYEENNATLLELDKNEIPIKAYRKHN